MAEIYSQPFGAQTSLEEVGSHPSRVGAAVADVLDDAFLTQRFDLCRADTEPALQHLGAVCPERRRAFKPYRLAVDPHRPGRHLVITIVVVDGLQETALLEARLVL